FGVGVLDVIMSRVLKRLQGRGSPGVALQDSPASIAPVDPFTPTDQGVRLEQLKTIAALRDSGALTEAEFEAEKRRILRG
ncbi:MAG TPA: SHOCT domain-containing protein, partial [Mycobacterium sp.]|nr:SHOCT domain-containing protein [Mycobacterium sp.]